MYIEHTPDHLNTLTIHLDDSSELHFYKDDEITFTPGENRECYYIDLYRKDKMIHIKRFMMPKKVIKYIAYTILDPANKDDIPKPDVQ